MSYEKEIFLSECIENYGISERPLNEMSDSQQRKRPFILPSHIKNGYSSAKLSQNKIS